MIGYLSNLPLTRKVQVIIMSAAAVALLASSLFLLLGQGFQARDSLRAQLSVLADVIGKNSLGALTFDDVEQANLVLSSLQAQSSVEAAALFSAAGDELGTLALSDVEHLPQAWIAEHHDSNESEYRTSGIRTLEIIQPIRFEGETIGTIYVRSNMLPVFNSIYTSMALTALALVIGTVISFVLSSLLTPAIVGPIQKLSGLAQSVSADEDFSLRASVDGQDEIASLATAINDMLKKLEVRDRRLEAHREHLQAEVDERTRSLAEANNRLEDFIEELRDARDKAEAASNAKSEFLARMSHEIRTPMNGVLGMTELMLASGDIDQRQRRYAENINHSAESLLSIINDILDFSKIEAGRLELDCAPFDFRDTVEEVTELLAEQASRKGLELLCDIEPTLEANRIGDGLRIRQVLLNLLGNAVKFTESGEVVLRVTRPAESVDRDDDLVAIEVRDTGIGIDPENIARVFDSFSQEDGSVTRRFGGTGLGLAISRQLVDLMGGTINVESSQGRGTSFWFEIALERQVKSEQSADESLKGVTTLVVDDNETNREILHSQLSSWGIDVTLAESGKQALQKIRGGLRPDVVLLDLHMPEMDGLDTAAALKESDACSDARIVLLSSLSRQLTQAERENLQITSTLTKPIRQRLLKACIAGLVNDVDTSYTATISQPEPEAEDAAELLDANVLLVEDNLVNQEVAKAMLKMLGCETTSAMNGKEAVELLIEQDQSFDIVLMDCQMPEMDGFSATRAVREHERDAGKSAQSIVALTANALTGDRERCLEAGMNDYLSKPFTMPALRDIIARQLGMASNDDESADASDSAA
ncbi:MAG: response regulator [Woeseiaceae bacterium]|nr:response regulator [Woeseiaceae bacterium]